MTRIEEAILRTVIYADIFNFPLTRAELHHYLIADTPVSLGAGRADAGVLPRFCKQELDTSAEATSSAPDGRI